MNVGALVALIGAEWLYLRALRILRRRGVAVSRWQQAAWHGAILLWAIGLLSPLDAAAEDGLAPHMVQHLLIADLGAPLLLAGMRNPVLAFLLPRSVLVPMARSRLRGALRTLRRPLVAIPVYALVLYAWHFDVLFTAAVEHPLVHVIQHGSFVGIGILVWWSALEPKRRRLQGELWKIAHILAARLLGMMLGMAFVLTRSPVYTDVYGDGLTTRAWGLDPVQDQQLAGGLMVTLDILIMAFALCFFFYRASKDAD